MNTSDRPATEMSPGRALTRPGHSDICMSMIPSVAEVDVRPLSRLYRALADDTRVRLVALLAGGELCVCHLEHALGLPQPTVSRHLQILKAAGVVDSRRDGTWVHYRLVPQDAPERQAALDAITRAFGAPRVLRADLARLKRARGPGACDQEKTP